MLVRRHSRQRQDSFIRSSDSNQGGYSDEMHTIKSYTKIFIVLWKIRTQNEGDLNARQDRALEKEMATHSSILAWRIPGTAGPDGLPSMGSHRVGHNWSDLAAA